MAGAPDRPLGLSWWVEPGLLLAGAYPGHPDPGIARSQLGKLLDAGIRCFIDLMEEDPRGAPPYAPLLEELAEERGLETEVLHLPIEDHDVPTEDALSALEARLASRLAAGTPCYVHCWGGRGRTGVIAGVALARLGHASAEDFATLIAERRQGLRGRSPETDDQEHFVASYLQDNPRPLWR